MPDILEQFRLDGKVAVVTGGSKGLGRAMAEAFCAVGASTVICSRHAAEVESAAADIAARDGGPCLGLQADVTLPEDVERLRDGVLARFGAIDVWVNNAGVNQRHPIEDFPVAAFERIVAVNLRGAWLGCRAVAPVMKRQGSGSVINMGSALSVVGLADRSAYCAAKAGIIGLTRTLALEWAAAGVRCNALCPGPFLTEINQALLDDPAKVQAVVGQTALKRWATLGEIQGAALFLASAASSYVTGSALFVDGGWVAG